MRLKSELDVASRTLHNRPPKGPWEPEGGRGKGAGPPLQDTSLQGAAGPVRWV